MLFLKREFDGFEKKMKNDRKIIILFNFLKGEKKLKFKQTFLPFIVHAASKYENSKLVGNGCEYQHKHNCMGSEALISSMKVRVRLLTAESYFSSRLCEREAVKFAIFR
jgi:hypothetical protein